MHPHPIDLKHKLDLFREHWSPRVVAEMNDYQIKLVKVQGDFVWHRHADTDELFFVIDGELTIEMRDGDERLGDVRLVAGQMVVVPKGVEHRPRAATECHVMLIEPRGVVNTGDGATNEITAANDVWI